MYKVIFCRGARRGDESIVVPSEETGCWEELSRTIDVIGAKLRSERGNPIRKSFEEYLFNEVMLCMCFGLQELVPVRVVGLKVPFLWKVKPILLARPPISKNSPKLKVKVLDLEALPIIEGPIINYCGRFNPPIDRVGFTAPYRIAQPMDRYWPCPNQHIICA